MTRSNCKFEIVASIPDDVDAIFIESPLFDGPTAEELIDVLHRFGDEEHLVPCTIDYLNSTVNGFIKESAAEDLNMIQFEYDIKRIISDMNNETDDHVYNFDIKTAIIHI